MHCCIPTPTTDSNTSTGMIWVTLNMPSAANRQGISHCLESGHPEYQYHNSAKNADVLWCLAMWSEFTGFNLLFNTWRHPCRYVLCLSMLFLFKKWLCSFWSQLSVASFQCQCCELFHCGANVVIVKLSCIFGLSRVLRECLGVFLGQFCSQLCVTICSLAVFLSTSLVLLDVCHFYCK